MRRIEGERTRDWKSKSLRGIYCGGVLFTPKPPEGVYGIGGGGGGGGGDCPPPPPSPPLFQSLFRVWRFWTTAGLAATKAARETRAVTRIGERMVDKRNEGLSSAAKLRRGSMHYIPGLRSSSMEHDPQVVVSWGVRHLVPQRSGTGAASGADSREWSIEFAKCHDYVRRRWNSRAARRVSALNEYVWIVDSSSMLSEILAIRHLFQSYPNRTE